MKKPGGIKSISIDGVKIDLSKPVVEYEKNDDGSYPCVFNITITKDGIQTTGMSLIPKK